MSPYASIVDAAILAFSQDFGYAESMLKAARSIEHKREVWALRKRLRDIEAVARRRCLAHVPFRCDAVCPCGFGDCKFAPDSRVVVISTKGKQVRPQDSDHPSYDREQVVMSVLASAV